jgi:hypothetical protein
VAKWQTNLFYKKVGTLLLNKSACHFANLPPFFNFYFPCIKKIFHNLVVAGGVLRLRGNRPLALSGIRSASFRRPGKVAKWQTNLFYKKIGTLLLNKSACHFATLPPFFNFYFP